MTIHRLLQRLSLTCVKPEGWLKDQLQIQMNGLSGRLYSLWDSVGSYSGWLGGSGESWERAPYYLDGLVPLAYYLEDREKMELCRRFIDWTLDSQDEDGNFGPYPTREDYWSRYVMLKVLAQYQEITGDERVLPFMLRYFAYIARAIGQRPLTEWSSFRVPDLLWCMKWAYELTGDPRIPDWARKLDANAFDWVDYMACLPFPRPAKFYINWKNLSLLAHAQFDQTVPFHATHIVNVTMGVKHPAMRYAFTGGEENRAAMYQGLEDLKKYHGVASGCINGDEHLAGNDPNQGSELCSVVEGMFSLSSMMEVFGDPVLGDHMERLAFNALPATISEDWMGHQYLQQANQVRCTNEKRPWFNNGPDANTFGLEPNFGCCTANMHQGWPKFVQALWFRQEDVLVCMVLAPSAVDTPLAGGRARVRLLTQYPFRDTLTYRIEEAPAQGLSLKIRVPGWCACPQVNGRPVQAEGGFILLSGLAAGTEIALQLPMEVRQSHWFRDSVAVERGPLVYGLDIQEHWEPYRSAAGVQDYQVYADSPWNWALIQDGQAQVEERPVTEVPFSHAGAPVAITLPARRLDSWQMEGGNAAVLPHSPVSCGAPQQPVRLIPFGCTRLRIAQFPWCL